MDDDYTRAMPGESLVEYGEDQRAQRKDHTPHLLATGFVIGMAGVGCALTIGFTPVTWTLLGVAVPFAVIPVVRLARI